MDKQPKKLIKVSEVQIINSGNKRDNNLIASYLVIRRLSRKLGDPLRRGMDGERDLLLLRRFTELADELAEELRLERLSDRDDLELPL